MIMVSRRQFLKKSALTALSWPLLQANFSVSSFNLTLSDKGSGILGRVLYNEAHTFTKPDIRSSTNGTHNLNDILSLSQPIRGISQSATNEIWFGMHQNAYIQSQNIQLVQNNLNNPREEINPKGQLAEITVPFTEARPGDKQNTRPHQIFFYGSTHWVYGLGKDSDTNDLYYLVIEDRWGETYYVHAEHMRIIDDDELNPSAPEIELSDKYILVDTKNQILTAYEGDKSVMISAISTGVHTENVDLITPPGEYLINYKRPSRHMVHSDKIGINDNELYGVPWVSYFTDTGIAFHGTYWHNDYTQPHSHGCVNMPIHAAKWIYLWTDPVVPPREKTYISKSGTKVVVI